MSSVDELSTSYPHIVR